MRSWDLRSNWCSRKSGGNLERCWKETRFLPHPCPAMSCVKRSRSAIRFFLKGFFRVSFPVGSRFEAFSWHRQQRQPLLYLLSVHGPKQGRHLLTCPVTAKKRARPISPTGRCQPKGWGGRAPFQIFSFHLSQGSGCGAHELKPMRRPSSNPNLRAGPGQSASATDPPPSVAPSPRWLFSSPPCSPSRCPAPATIF